MKNGGLYLPSFQSSAGSSQEGAAGLVQSFASQTLATVALPQFWLLILLCLAMRRERTRAFVVKITGETALDKALDSPLHDVERVVLIGFSACVPRRSELRLYRGSFFQHGACRYG